MGLGYQQRDHEIVDYGLFKLEGSGLYFRGPEPELEGRSYVACIGAAQTFGCLCERPFPALLAERLGAPVLNLGVAGAGPRFFARRSRLLEYVNRASVTIVQVMSARSEDNSLVDSGGLEYLTRRSDGARLGAEPAYRELLTSRPRAEVEIVVAETRENWIRSFRRLLGAIEAPTILFWFSKRTPEYSERYEDVHALFGEYPQLVTDAMVARIKRGADAYVECVSTRGLPHHLVSRFTGRPVSIFGRSDLGGTEYSINPYYPSPEMHEDAATALLDVCREHVESPRPVA